MEKSELQKIIDEQGKFFQSGATLDIGFRLEALEKEAVGLRSFQDFRSLVEYSPDLVARFDRDLHHVYVNPAVLRTTGLSLDDYIGKSNRDLEMPEDLLGLWDQCLKKAFETGRTIRETILNCRQ